VSPFVDDAHVADLLLLERDGELHAVRAGEVRLTPQPHNDPARRIATVEFDAAIPRRAWPLARRRASCSMPRSTAARSPPRRSCSACAIG
jgi:hypothetical protein